MNRLGSRLTAILAVAALALVAMGCGGDDDDSDEATPSDPPAESDESPNDSSDAEADGEDVDGSDTDTAGAGLLGTVVVDGVEYEITELYNCDPLDDGTIERSLELQGLGESDGERVQIDIVIQQIAGVSMDDVSWSGPEGVFAGPAGSDVDGPATVDVALINDGAIVTGSATLVDAMGEDETIGVGFNLEVPVDTIACR